MGDLRAASTPALALLVAHGVPHTVHEYEIEAPSGPEAHRGARVAHGAAAAAALGVAQSVLSRQISTLEGDLGGRLFHRTGRGATLSAFGQSLMALLNIAAWVRFLRR